MKITKEQAEIMLKKMPEMAEEIYKHFPELKPLKVAESWIDLDKINGYYITEDSVMSEHICNTHPNLCHQNVFKTQKQAESLLAYAQLTQLMANCEDCDVDWSSTVNKYSIWRSESFLESISHCSVFHFLAFNTENIRDEFLHKHEALIKTFYQL